MTGKIPKIVFSLLRCSDDDPSIDPEENIGTSNIDLLMAHFLFQIKSPEKKKWGKNLFDA